MSKPGAPLKQRSASGSIRLRLGLAALMVAGAFHGARGEPRPDTHAHAIDAGSPADNTPPRPAIPPPAARPDLAALDNTSRQIDALVGGTLDVAIAPQTLFDVDLGDETAIRVEVERLGAVVQHPDAPSVAAAAPAPPDPRPTSRKRSPSKPARPPPPDAGLADAGVPLATLDPLLYQARVALDRARLAFYRLPQAHRQALLDQHAQRQQADREARAARDLSAAEQKAQAAESARKQALAAAGQARSEAERLVAEESARLLAIARRYADFEADLARRQIALKQRAEKTLLVRRQVREGLAQAQRAGDDEETTLDRRYDELRAFLRASRDELADALGQRFAASHVPGAPHGEDRLRDLPQDIDRSAVDAARRELKLSARRLQALEAAYRNEHIDQLYDEVGALNGDRLSLLSRLSEAKQKNITGFTAAGFNQAAAELRQVALVLRYHLTATRRWLADLVAPAPHTDRSRSLVTTGLVLVEVLMLGFAFLWWRRKSDSFLHHWRNRILEERRRIGTTAPSPLYRVLRFVEHTRRPLEWLVFAHLLVWLLPADSRHQLEVTLAITIATGTLGGALAVDIIDTLAGHRALAYRPASAAATDKVRLRSLRLAGRTVVGIGLILALSAELVGEGTIYRWVLSVCWLAAIPVVLVIIRWWRSIIFARVAAAHKKKAFDHWVVAHQTGWKSFPTAVFAGVVLFLGGAVRVARGWLTRFDLARRAHAWLFRRGMDRRAEEQRARLVLHPLPEPLFAMLGPETPSRDNVAGSADEKLGEVVERIARQGGGVFAVVGERGRGKTTLLRRVRDAKADIVLIDCPPSGLGGMQHALAAAMQSEAEGSPTASPAAAIEACAARLDAPGKDTGLLIDHAHRLIHPVMGGLAAFDTVIQIARTHSARCAWFFAFNEVVWRFLERARGARPLFDDVVRIGPWREEEITQLITARCRQADITPSFAHVMDKLPADADEADRAEAVQRVASGYYRMIWDYSAGNPGVALHAWRRSLGLDDQGQLSVKLFQVPDPRELEQMPEHAAFVLRAVIQLELAEVDDVMRATMLRRAQVADVLRYGMAHGYFEQVDGRYRVTWGWFRPITRFLQRRHLLPSGQ